VSRFVEFYGKGVAEVPLANRATLGNMSPESGSTAAIFPIDDEVTVDYLRLTGRTDDLALVEAYAKAQGMWDDAKKEPVFSEYIELDLVDVVPSIAGPSESYLVPTSRAAGIEPPIDGVFPLLDDTAGPAARRPSQHQDQINLDE